MCLCLEMWKETCFNVMSCLDMSLCVCTVNLHCTAFSICPLYVISCALGLNSFIFMQFLLPSAMSCTLLGLIQVEFISRKIFKRKYMKYSFGGRQKSSVDWLDQPPWLSNAVSLSLKDIVRILTVWSSFQWKELLLLNWVSSIVNLNISLISLSYSLLCDTYDITSELCYHYN